MALVSDSDYARRSVVHARIDMELHVAERLLACAAAPPASLTRRLLVLHEAVGDLDAAAARGHADLSNEWSLIAAVAQGALEAQEAALAAAPVRDDDFARGDGPDGRPPARQTNSGDRPELPPLTPECEAGRHWKCGAGEDECTCPCHEDEGEDE